MVINEWWHTLFVCLFTDSYIDRKLTHTIIKKNNERQQNNKIKSNICWTVSYSNEQWNKNSFDKKKSKEESNNEHITKLHVAKQKGEQLEWKLHRVWEFKKKRLKSGFIVIALFKREQEQS